MSLTLQDILQAYLVGYIYWFMIPMGCTALLMLHSLTGGLVGLSRSAGCWKRVRGCSD